MGWPTSRTPYQVPGTYDMVGAASRQGRPVPLIKNVQTTRANVYIPGKDRNMAHYVVINLTLTDLTQTLIVELVTRGECCLI